MAAKWSSWRLSALVLSIAGFAAAAVHGWAALAVGADVHGCVDVHGLEYVAFVISGMLLGLALGPSVRQGAGSVASAILPNVDERSRVRRVNALATLFILLGMVVDGFWLSPGFNVFIDTHRTLMVEADIVLYGMGILSGAGWYWLLDRQAWIGLLTTVAMALMVIGSVLTTHSWC